MRIIFVFLLSVVILFSLATVFAKNVVELKDGTVLLRRDLCRSSLKAALNKFTHLMAIYQKF
jgi:hypothetical protein